MAGHCICQLKSNSCAEDTMTCWNWRAGSCEAVVNAEPAASVLLTLHNPATTEKPCGTACSKSLERMSPPLRITLMPHTPSTAQSDTVQQGTLGLEVKPVSAANSHTLQPWPPSHWGTPPRHSNTEDTQLTQIYGFPRLT